RLVFADDGAGPHMAPMPTRALVRSRADDLIARPIGGPDTTDPGDTRGPVPPSGSPPRTTCSLAPEGADRPAPRRTLGQVVEVATLCCGFPMRRRLHDPRHVSAGQVG